MQCCKVRIYWLIVLYLQFENNCSKLSINGAEIIIVLEFGNNASDFILHTLLHEVKTIFSKCRVGLPGGDPDRTAVQAAV